MMFHAVIVMNGDGSLVEGTGQFGPFSTSEMVAKRLLNHFNVLPVASPRQMAEWHNRLQELAEQTRLGIPITISSDPRHAFTDKYAKSVFAGDFSRWPDPV